MLVGVLDGSASVEGKLSVNSVGAHRKFSNISCAIRRGQGTDGPEYYFVCVVERILDMHVIMGALNSWREKHTKKKKMLIPFVLGRRIEPESKG